MGWGPSEGCRYRVRHTGTVPPPAFGHSAAVKTGGDTGGFEAIKIDLDPYSVAFLDALGDRSLRTNHRAWRTTRLAGLTEPSTQIPSRRRERCERCIPTMP